MAAPIETATPIISENSSSNCEDQGDTTIIPISTEGPTPSTAAVAAARKLVIPEGKVSVLQKIFHFIKIISAVALFAVGIAALICLQFGVVVSTPSLILMVAILLVSFVIVIMAIQDSIPSQAARRMKQQIQQFSQENARLQAANAELTEQIDQLKQLHTRLSDFGDRLETHTGDFRDLIADFKTSLEDFESVGSRVKTMLSPFEKLAQSLQDTFSKESVQQMITTISALKVSLGGLKDLIAENKVLVAQLKADAAIREEQILSLELRKGELEAACSALASSVSDLRTSTASLQAVESRITSSVGGQDGKRIETSTATTTAASSQESSSQGQGGDQTDGGNQEGGQGGTNQRGSGSSNVIRYDEQGFPID